MKMKKAKYLVLFLGVLSILFVFLFGYNILFPSNSIATIVIDAGHGGYDPGSIGPDGTYEKDLALEIALRTGRSIKKLNPKIQVFYTRTNDTVDWANNEEEDLIERVRFASTKKADYFLSIHLNASENSEAYGYNAYIRSDDLVSQTIAEKINQNLEAKNWVINRGIKYTDANPLYVVNEQTIPSLLFEVGFITNPQECKDLKKANNQELIANSIANGYNDYILSIQKKEDS